MADYFLSLDVATKKARLDGLAYWMEYADLQSLMTAIAGEENQ